MPTPPSVQKVNPADQPILQFALTSETLPLWEVNEYADNLLAQRIATVNGVAQVNVYGAQKYAVRVQLDRPAHVLAMAFKLNYVADIIEPRGRVLEHALHAPPEIRRARCAREGRWRVRRGGSAPPRR